MKTGFDLTNIYCITNRTKVEIVFDPVSNMASE